MIKFSVVIPVYKVEEYLDQCVQSVVEQTYRRLEILLVDDGSPDRCGAMCDDWAKKDDRIRVIHQENGGLSDARNTGIRHAGGDYVLFLDSDDWWEQNTVLETLAKQLEKTPVDVLTYNYRKSVDGVPQPAYFDEQIPSHDTPVDIAAMVQKDLWVCSSWNKAVRFSLFEQGDLFFRKGITSEDMDWSLRLALKAGTFAFVNCCVLAYRQRSMSITHSVSKKSVVTLRDNIACCIELLKKAGKDMEDCLNPYVAYLFATLIHNVASLPRGERKDFTADLKAMKYLLACSGNPKVRLIHRCSRLMGLSGTMMLLRLRTRLQTRSGKGG